LPAPPQKFGGEINPNAFESKSCWTPRVVPQKGTPNILLTMTDGIGFAAASTFGGVIPTPRMDRIVADSKSYEAGRSRDGRVGLTRVSCQLVWTTAGGFHVPLPAGKIEGGVSLGQYRRITK
jgi:hypothetical protein